MNKLESIFIGAVIGPVLPILLFLAGWWISLIFVTDQIIFVFALIGLVIGCIIDIIISKHIMKAYWWNQIILAMIYLFYSVGSFGFFMGVPIFNLAVGAIAGIFMGRRLYYRGITKEQLQRVSASFAHFSAIIMVFVSIASAYFAAKDIKDIALNLKGMLRLQFLPTNQEIIVLIVVGGIGLVLVQYWIAKKLTCWAYRIENKGITVQT
ncbi:MAG: hypothetical protein ACOX22_04915 [Caldicoprobacterales bacterium]|nr:hypothetical protein [Clostridiales bacterium]